MKSWTILTKYFYLNVVVFLILIVLRIRYQFDIID